MPAKKDNQTRKLIEANAKLLQEVEHWRNLYLAEVNKRMLEKKERD